MSDVVEDLKEPLLLGLEGQAQSLNGGVSVIIPSHNAAATLGATLRSLMSERPLIHELIVVDDSSVDGTAIVAQNYAAELGLPLVLLSTNCRDVGGARNHALDNATGRWIYFLDADDVHEEGGLRALLSAERAPDRPELVVGSYYCKRPDGERQFFSHNPQRISAEDYLAGRSVVIVVGSGLIARTALRGLRFPERLAYDEDTLFWAALLATCRTACIDTPVMTYNMSFERSDERLVRHSECRFEHWRRHLLALEEYGVRRVALGRREAFMAIKIARIHIRQGNHALAGYFLAIVRKSPKTRADAYRWMKFRLKLALQRTGGRTT